MQVHPQKSREARAEIDLAPTLPALPTAVSIVHAQDSLSREICDTARPLATRPVRDADGSQQFPPIPAALLQSIFHEPPLSIVDRMAADAAAFRDAERRALGGAIGLGVVVLVVMLLSFFTATGGQM